MSTEFPIHDVALVLIAMFNCITAILAWMAHTQSKTNGASINELQVSTNGRMDQLIASTERAAFGAGEERARLAGESAAKDMIIRNQQRKRHEHSH